MGRCLTTPRAPRRSRSGWASVRQVELGVKIYLTSVDKEYEC